MIGLPSPLAQLRQLLFPRLATAFKRSRCRLAISRQALPRHYAGLSKDVDAEGFRSYRRPEGKSGGHGVGWSEIPRYSFRLPDGWEETPVSIADLGGTEVAATPTVAFVLANLFRCTPLRLGRTSHVWPLSTPGPHAVIDAAARCTRSAQRMHGYSALQHPRADPLHAEQHASRNRYHLSAVVT